MTARALAASLALPLLAGCLSYEWRRQLYERPVEAEALQGLEVGATRLDDVLARFGAPLRVLERRDGAALAYGWLRSAKWGLGLSVPLGDQSASFDYASIDQRMRGVLFLFDEEWVLAGWREGALTDLLLQPAAPAALVPGPEAPPAPGP